MRAKKRAKVAVRAKVKAAGLAAIVALAGACSPAVSKAPVVGHVFTIVLENESFDRSFGPGSKAPYLANTLARQGALLTQYYGIGHNSLDNYIAMISGQAPNEATQRDCTIFSEFSLTQPALDAHGQALGTGCVYPAMVKTIADQLEASGRTWRGYMEDMGDDPKKERVTCGHPPIGSIDSTTRREPGDQYATKHNPFMYFHSVIDDTARCNSHVVNLRELRADLASVATTPSYVFITPNLCNDGHDGPCIDHAPGGLIQIDRFLREWVPAITGSPAYAADGVLIITFDEASGPPGQDSSACCGEQGLAGEAHPPGGDGPGGGRVGAVILSPFVHGGTASDRPYNHYAMLRWVEDQFGLAHLGYAAEPGLAVFGADIFNRRR
jgi:phosphatidylinositol-3-phosphatase